MGARGEKGAGERRLRLAKRGGAEIGIIVEYVDCAGGLGAGGDRLDEDIEFDGLAGQGREGAALHGQPNLTLEGALVLRDRGHRSGERDKKQRGQPTGAREQHSGPVTEATAVEGARQAGRVTYLYL